MPAPDPLEAVIRALEAPASGTSDFDLNPDVTLAANRVLRAAGVLVPLLAAPGGVQVILTKRASHLKHHPGQIAFPGGKVDEADGGPIDAALREADEEIALDPGNVEVLGTMPPHETVTGFLVTPVLGRVRGAFTAVPEAGEVEEVFSVPLSHVTDLSMYRIERRRWRGEWRRYHVVPYGPYYIWGATARILHALATRMQP